MDDILPEAFAAIIIADERVLGMHPYDVQILAGIALHMGYLSEMNTGEGKTLSATMPLYLNALTGKTCYLVTTNEYLAIRDGEEMGQVYNFMGISCHHVLPEEESEKMDDYSKWLYSANIVYTTNSGLGFDFLFNNLVTSAEDRFFGDMNYVIIDEADAVLLDSAIMPLVVSGVPRVQSNLYSMCDFFVTTLCENVDYEKEDNTIWLTEKGVKYAEDFFGIPNYYGKEHFEINRHVTLAMRARFLLEQNKDYVVTDENTVELFDKSTGRLLSGVKLRGGQHQAIETKEKVEVTQEYRTVASVTFQNFFLMFDKMAGMSGTIYDSKDELFDIYHKRIVVIPPNRPMQRIDRKDLYFPNAQKQFWSAVAMVIQIHKTGQPVLVVLNTVTDTDMFSRLLHKEQIAHNVLNASNAFWEAEIIKNAGKKGAVTVATPMAGRGTDIKLGDGVKELGGLAVIGVGRMDNTRSERQARGRAGRQGDPGFSLYFVSIEDDVVGAEDKDVFEKIIDGRKKTSRRKLKHIINNAQKVKNEYSEISRKQQVQYDEVLQIQRDYIYATRNNLLDGNRIEESSLISIAEENVWEFLDSIDQLTISDLSRYILDNISYTLDDGLNRLDYSNKDAVASFLIRRVKNGLRYQREKIRNLDLYEQFIREATLHAVDDGWVELIDYLEQLKGAVSGRASAQRNVVYEYQNEAYESYRANERYIKRNIIRNIMLSDVTTDKEGALSIVYP